MTCQSGASKRQDSHLRLAFFLTCASLSLAPRMYHLRLGFSLTCASLSGGGDDNIPWTCIQYYHTDSVWIGWMGWVGGGGMMTYLGLAHIRPYGFDLDRLDGLGGGGW